MFEQRIIRNPSELSSTEAASMLLDREFALVQPLLRNSTKRGRPSGDAKLMLEAALYVSLADGPWSCLPKRFGKPNTAYRQFVRWSDSGTIDRLLGAFPPRGPHEEGNEKLDPTPIILNRRLAPLARLQDRLRGSRHSVAQEAEFVQNCDCSRATRAVNAQSKRAKVSSRRAEKAASARSPIPGR